MNFLWKNQDRRRCRRRWLCQQDDCGVLAAFVAVLVVALMSIAGFAIDGGRAIAAQRLAGDEAEQAARTGAEQLSITDLRSGRVTIDPAVAVSAAERYMSLSGNPGTALVSGNLVTVRVIVTVPTVILGVIGVPSITVSASASASDVEGVTRQN